MTTVPAQHPGPELARAVLDPMKRRFVGKDEVVDLLGVCLVGGENLFILGPPGTAKSALVQDLGRRFGGRVFDYLLTRFTEPNELFGPFDIRKLREGDLVTNTEGMLPEAEFVFLDELLNANSAILNSLLMALNERVFRRGRETRRLPALMFVGASNRLPEDETLGALFDRFLLRVMCDNVDDDRLRDVLDAGWQLERDAGAEAATTVQAVRSLQGMVPTVDLSPAREAYLGLVGRLRRAGVAVSDRRAVKLQRVIAASALLCGRSSADPSDLWVMRYIWDVMEQRELIHEMVDQVLDEAAGTADDDGPARHGRASRGARPDAEAIARDLSAIEADLDAEGLDDAAKAHLQDRVGVLASRVQWVESAAQRAALEETLTGLWRRLGVEP